MHSRFNLLFVALLASASSLFAQTSGDPLARFHTDLGDIDVVLLQSIAPKNVANFVHYMNRNNGAYNNSFIHRSVPGFVIQGGGYKFTNNTKTPIATDAPVMNEFHVSNIRGTLAMAKLPNDPNSATDQWFFNLVDNSANLDAQNGGFTVFARIMDTAGLATIDAIAGVPTYNQGGDFTQIPLRNYSGSGADVDANFVHVIWVKQIPQIDSLTKINATTIKVAGKGSASLVYQLQSSSSPTSGFTNLTSVTADSSGNIAYNDASAGTKKFYRFLIP